MKSLYPKLIKFQSPTSKYSAKLVLSTRWKISWKAQGSTVRALFPPPLCSVTIATKRCDQSNRAFPPPFRLFFVGGCGLSPSNGGSSCQWNKGTAEIREQVSLFIQILALFGFYIENNVLLRGYTLTFVKVNWCTAQRESFGLKWNSLLSIKVKNKRLTLLLLLLLRRSLFAFCLHSTHKLFVC